MAEFRTYTAIGQREDLSNTIYNIAPTETPVVSSIGKTTAKGTTHEWQTDNLAAASAAGLVEGADASGASDTLEGAVIPIILTWSLAPINSPKPVEMI